MLSPRALSLKDGTRDDITAIYAELAPISKAIISDARETVRNLSIVSGAMATGALVLLGSGFSSVPQLIVIGTLFLLLEVILTFGYLIHELSKDSLSFLKRRKESLSPSFRVLNLCEDVHKHKITEEALFAEAKVIAAEAVERARNEREKVLSDEPSLNHWDSIFMIVLGLGILFICLGVLFPYICPNF